MNTNNENYPRLQSATYTLGLRNKKTDTFEPLNTDKATVTRHRDGSVSVRFFLNRGGAQEDETEHVIDHKAALLRAMNRGDE